MAKSGGGAQLLFSGPWKSVRSTTDPFDDPPDQLTDALNGYIPDPANGSGFYQRPAVRTVAGNTSLGTARAAGQWHYTSTAGVEINFMATQGKLYRVTAAGVATDVTPVGVTIDNGLTTRVFFQQVNDQLIATDGVNRPWIGTNLSATPITGTYIDIDGAATAWTAFGAPTFLQGGIVFILGSWGGGAGLVPRIAIVWCEPNQPAVGYVQSGYTDFWNLFQTSSRPITGIYGLNTGLIVWRDQGIGFIAGTLNGNFSTAATNQAISDDIGLLASATIDRYLNNVYFADQFARPQVIVGTTLQEPQLWLQMRSQVEAQTAAAGYAAAVTNVAIGIIEPNLNLYLCAPFASGSLGVNNTPPNVIYAFDAKTTAYVGRWVLSTGCAITGMGIQRDANNAPQLWLVAESTPGDAQEHLWQFQRLSAALWTDSQAAQTVSITTGRLGYSASIVWDAGDIGNLVTMNAAAVAVTVTTPYNSATASGTASPQTSQDGTYRVVIGMDVLAARGIQITASPTLGSTQWGVQRWEMLAVPSKAGVLDA